LSTGFLAYSFNLLAIEFLTAIDTLYSFFFSSFLIVLLIVLFIDYLAAVFLFSILNGFKLLVLAVDIYDLVGVYKDDPLLDLELYALDDPINDIFPCLAVIRLGLNVHSYLLFSNSFISDETSVFFFLILYNSSNILSDFLFSGENLSLPDINLDSN
jgi:hypothetical protein